MWTKRSWFLLTRTSRNTPDGIELTLWAATADDPLRLVVDRQEAVCFVERGVPIALPADARRRELPLARLGGGRAVPPAPATCRRFVTGVALRESHVEPVERFLMERFVRAGFEAEGELERDGDEQVMRNPVLRPAHIVPRLDVVALDIETRGGTEELYSIAGTRTGGVAPGGAASGATHVTGSAPDAVVFMVGSGEPERRDGYTLH